MHIRRVGNEVYRFAFPIYRPLYRAFKNQADRTERKLLLRYLDVGSVAVDAGANIGVYSEFLSRCVGSTGSVHSFEPDPDNFRHLHATLRQTHNVHLQKLALGDRTGEATLFISGRLNVDHRTYPTANEPRKSITIRSVRLDDYFPPGTKVDFIKMDIQGYEYHALKGATRVLTENPNIKLLLEFWPYGLRTAGSSGQDLLAFLEDNRFRCLAPTEAPLNLSLAAVENEPDAYFNIFARRY
jgi:FkbM family methyltransferase